MRTIDAGNQESDQWQLCFRFLCRCLHNAPVDVEAFRHLTAPITQWEYFIQQLRWHRVAGHVWHNIAPFAQQLPEPVIAELRRLRRQISVNYLRNMSILQALGSLLGEHNIPFVALKGVPLSQHLYGDPARRFSKDVDLLIRESDLETTRDLLVRNGFQQLIPMPDLPPITQRRYQRLVKDATFRHRDNGASLELHWRLMPNPHYLPANRFDPFANATPCPELGTTALLMSPEYNALYLITHAAHSAWGRLSWLKDIAELMDSPLDWDNVIQLARDCRIETTVWTTLQLAHKLLGARLPVTATVPPLPATVQARYLARHGEIALQRSTYPGPLANYLQALLYSGNPRYIWFHLVCHMGLSIHDIAMLPLPRALFFLYYPLRPVLWLIRHKTGQRMDYISQQPEHHH